jgi:hypothetical protein
MNPILAMVQSVIGDPRRLRRWLIGAVLAAVVVGGLGLWAVIAGGSWLLRQVPALAEATGGVTADLRQQAEAWVPGVGRQLDAWLPAATPAADVGGEDLAGIARFPGLVRTAYAFGDGERRVAYRGPAEWRAVADFYARELAARGFTGTVTAASATAEMRLYRNGSRVIELRVAAAGALGGPVTELELRERGGEAG